MPNIPSNANLPPYIKGVYRKILTALWTGKWVSSNKLLSLTKQKYFDRRIRELRDEYGFDIESKHMSGGWSYCLKSKKPRFKKRRRQYFTKKQKEEVIKRDGLKCNICGFVPANGHEGLQFDHRIPFKERQGPTTLDNLQILCAQCNIIKRRACQQCTKKSCKSCVYAYPEQLNTTYLITLSPKTQRRYDALAKSKHRNLKQLLTDAIEQYCARD